MSMLCSFPIAFAMRLHLSDVDLLPSQGIGRDFRPCLVSAAWRGDYAGVRSRICVGVQQSEITIRGSSVEAIDVLA